MPTHGVLYSESWQPFLSTASVAIGNRSRRSAKLYYLTKAYSTHELLAPQDGV